MKGTYLASLALLALAGCSDGRPPTGDDLAQSQGTAGSQMLTAVVTGFGGPGGRRGRVDVYLRSGERAGVIRGVLAEELDCSVGDRVPAKPSGKSVVAINGACRKNGVP